MLSSVVALSEDIVVIVEKSLHKPVFQTLNPGIHS